MSSYSTTVLTGTQAEFRFTPTVMKWNPADYPANIQLSLTGLNGGSYAVWILPVGDTDYRRYIQGASELDLCLLAGKNAPLFSAVKVVVAGTGGAEVTVRATLWERGL